MPPNLNPAETIFFRKFSKDSFKESILLRCLEKTSDRVKIKVKVRGGRCGEEWGGRGWYLGPQWEK